MTELQKKIEQLRTWLNSRKLVYCEPLQEIDFAKDIDNGLKLLEDVEKEVDELKQKLRQLISTFPNWDRFIEGKGIDELPNIVRDFVVATEDWKKKFEELLEEEKEEEAKSRKEQLIDLIRKYDVVGTQKSAL